MLEVEGSPRRCYWVGIPVLASERTGDVEAAVNVVEPFFRAATMPGLPSGRGVDIAVQLHGWLHGLIRIQSPP